MSNFQFSPDLAKVSPWESFLSSATDNRQAVLDLRKEAIEYLEFYSWCKRILNVYAGIVVPKIVGVFLFEIEPSREGVDKWVWVIIGDLPPAYLTCDNCPNPACALDAYIGAMSEWVSAARSGASVANLIPVNVPATTENAETLDRRLTFLDKRILSEYQEDLNG